MTILKNIKTPTGNILVIKGEKGKLECLSLGDYGRDVNVKADFLGLDREPSPVRHTGLLPLEEKWVITISTQYGCTMGCKFCDVPLVGYGGNATLDDLLWQVRICRELHREVPPCKHLNIHFARMGEPTWNPNVLQAAKYLNSNLAGDIVHPVVSTMMPKKNKWLAAFLGAWIHIKNEWYRGNAGLQISINSTDEKERREIFNGSALSIKEISECLYGLKPLGRKITLNFAVAGWKIDPRILYEYFPPERFIIKLTPMHKTKTAEQNDIRTDGDYTEYYPYKAIEDSLKEYGYDVLVFIASNEEDSSRITCGNAILADSENQE